MDSRTLACINDALETLAWTQDQVAAAACAGELPAERVITVLRDQGLDLGRDHLGEHGDLRLIRAPHRRAEGRQIAREDGGPGVAGGVSQRPGSLAVDARI